MRNKSTQNVNNKIKIITFNEIIIVSYKKAITMQYIVALIVCMLLSSVLNPYLLKIAYEQFMQNKIQSGMHYVIAWIIGNIAITIYNNKVIFKLKTIFNTKVQETIELLINNEIADLDNMTSRDMKNDRSFCQMQFDAAYYAHAYATQITDSINLAISFIGYVFWIFYVSPLSIILYVVVGYTLIKYLSRNTDIEDTEYKDTRYKNYDKFWYYFDNRHYLKIHNREHEAIDGMESMRRILNVDKYDHQKKDNDFSDTIKIVFDLTFIFNCIVLSKQLHALDVVTYVQYCTIFHSSISGFFMLKTQYNTAIREYEKFETRINACYRKIRVGQIYDYTEICINRIDYTYPKKTDDNEPFKLCWNTPMIFVAGSIVNVLGDYGNGKSTFLDILSGIISQTQYTGEYFVKKNDKYIKIDGFECLECTRCYSEQSEKLANVSIAQNIVGKLEDISDKDTQLMYEALELCSCFDFVTIDEKTDPSKKWIYATNVKMSGGEEGMIKLARSMFNIIKTRPKFAILDEIDRGISVSSIKTIMSKIFAYMRKNGITLFVTGHHTETQNMDYDAKLEFKKGVMHVIKKIES